MIVLGAQSIWYRPRENTALPAQDGLCQKIKVGVYYDLKQV